MTIRDVNEMVPGKVPSCNLISRAYILCSPQACIFGPLPIGGGANNVF